MSDKKEWNPFEVTVSTVYMIILLWIAAIIGLIYLAVVI